MQVPRRPCYAVGTGSSMAGSSGFLSFCPKMEMMDNISSLESTMFMWSERGFLGPVLPFGSQDKMIFTLMPSTTLTHRGINIVVNGVSTVDHHTIQKLHGFSPLSLEFPWHPWPCSPWPPSPWWTAAPHSRLSAEQALLAVCNAEILSGQWHTDLVWPPFQHKALRSSQGIHTSSELHQSIPGFFSPRTFCSWRPR